MFYDACNCILKITTWRGNLSPALPQLFCENDGRRRGNKEKEIARVEFGVREVKAQLEINGDELDSDVTTVALRQPRDLFCAHC